MDGGTCWAAIHGVAKSRTRLSDFTFTFHFHALEKEMAAHSSVLAWRIPGTGEPGGLPSMGSHRIRHDWSDLAEHSTVNHVSETRISYNICIVPFLFSQLPHQFMWTRWFSSKLHSVTFSASIATDTQLSQTLQLFMHPLFIYISADSDLLSHIFSKFEWSQSS